LLCFLRLRLRLRLRLLRRLRLRLLRLRLLLLLLRLLRLLPIIYQTTAVVRLAQRYLRLDLPLLPRLPVHLPYGTGVIYDTRACALCRATYRGTCSASTRRTVMRRRYGSALGRSSVLA
jgi:hypothetical protein